MLWPIANALSSNRLFSSKATVSIFQTLFRRKFARFKSEKVALYRLLVGLGFLVTPLILLVAPLPGYLVYSSAPLSIGFAVGISCLLAISVLNHLVATVMFSDDEKRWLHYAFSGKLPFKERQFLLQCRLYFFAPIALAGLIKIEQWQISNTTVYLLSLICLYLIGQVLAIALLRQCRRLSQRLTTIELTTTVKVLRLCTRGGLPFCIGWLLCTALSLLLALVLSDPKVGIVYLAIVSIFTCFFAFSLMRLIRKNVQNHQTFLHFIALNFPQTLLVKAYWILAIATTMAIISPITVHFSA